MPQAITEAFELDDHERLVLWRRREGLEQSDALREFGVTRGAYQAMEEGKRAVTVALDPLDGITEQEFCMLMRMRYGMTQGDVAEALGVTRVWVNRMEAGTADVDRLMAYWS